MVAFIALWPRAMKSYAHKGMAGFGAKMAHSRNGMSMIGLVRVLRGRKRVFELVTRGIEEVAVRVCPEDFAADEFGRHLFATVA